MNYIDDKLETCPSCLCGKLRDKPCQTCVRIRMEELKEKLRTKPVCLCKKHLFGHVIQNPKCPIDHYGEDI